MKQRDAPYQRGRVWKSKVEHAFGGYFLYHILGPSERYPETHVKVRIECLDKRVRLWCNEPIIVISRKDLQRIAMKKFNFHKKKKRDSYKEKHEGMEFFAFDGRPWNLKHVVPPTAKVTETLPDGTEPGWYFLDETENLHGPYKSHERAVEALKSYGESL